MYLGDILSANLSPRHIEDAYRSRQADGYDATTIRLITLGAREAAGPFGSSFTPAETSGVSQEDMDRRSAHPEPGRAGHGGYGISVVSGGGRPYRLAGRP